MVHTRSQLVDGQNCPENVDRLNIEVENQNQNLDPIQAVDASNQELVGPFNNNAKIGASYTPIVGRTQSSPYDENYGADIGPVNALKELIRVKLENQVLMELYKEQVAGNGRKAAMVVVPERSHVSYTKDEASQSSPYLEKGKEKVDEIRTNKSEGDHGRH